jgi:AraC family transcriptional regulator
MRSIKTIQFDNCKLTLSVYPGGMYMKPHYDAENKISIILDGKLTEKYSDTFVQAGKGSLVVKPTHSLHETFFESKETRILSLSFSKDYSSEFLINNLEWITHPQISFLALQMFYQLKHTCNDTTLNRHLTNFSHQITKVKSNQSKIIPKPIENLRENLIDNYVLQPTIGSNANKLMMHRSYASREFKKYFTIPPVKYRNYIRFNNLVAALSHSDKPLAEIAYECGFTDPSHMSRIILKETGHTATNFRMLLQSF